MVASEFVVKVCKGISQKAHAVHGEWLAYSAFNDCSLPARDMQYLTQLDTPMIPAHLRWLQCINIRVFPYIDDTRFCVRLSALEQFCHAIDQRF